MKPICVPCRRFFRAKKNGQYFIEAMPRGDERRPEPGNAAPEKWQPYKLWVGDLWECEGCGTQTIVGVARDPVSEHYLPDFEERARLHGAHAITVNDC